MVILGLTGSIGMGKSTTAEIFRDFGVPVHDADAAVHVLYAGAAVDPVEAAFPGVVRDGRVDRALLSARVLGDWAALKQLEGIVHPLVSADREAFLAVAKKAGVRMAVFDIPLLFETGADGLVDAVVVVSAPFDVQKSRVLAREGMTEERFLAIVERQMPDAEKRRRAHFVVRSDEGLTSARIQIEAIIRSLASMPGRRNS